MKRFAMALALMCALSASTFAGNMPTGGKAEEPPPPGNMPTTGAASLATTDDANGLSNAQITVILAIIDLLI